MLLDHNLTDLWQYWKLQKVLFLPFIADILKSTWKTYTNDLNFNLFGLD